MPQMSPLNWLFLYMYVLLILLLVNVFLSYFYLNIYSDKKKILMKKNFYKWMW